MEFLGGNKHGVGLITDGEHIGDGVGIASWLLHIIVRSIYGI